MGILKEEANRIASLQNGWAMFLESETAKPYFSDLDAFVTAEYCSKACFPPQEEIFAAFRTPAPAVRAVILGQDPYHEKGQAMGLSFSVHEGVRTPPSLRNILKELEADCGIARTKADLTDWAGQGVFLLNTVLTVEEGKANSHAGHGWEAFARNALHYVIEKNNGDVAGILWGKPAQTYKDLFDEDMVVVSPHPSPLSAYRGFFGGRPFSRTNELLRKRFLSEIQWG